MLKNPDYLYPVVLLNFVLSTFCFEFQFEWSFTEALFGSSHDDPPSSDKVSSCIRNSWAADAVNIVYHIKQVFFFIREIWSKHWHALHFDNL